MVRWFEMDDTVREKRAHLRTQISTWQRFITNSSLSNTLKHLWRALAVKISTALTVQRSRKAHLGSSGAPLSGPPEESPDQKPGSAARRCPRRRTSRARALSRACRTGPACPSSVRESTETSGAAPSAAAAPLHRQRRRRRTERWSGGSSGRNRGCWGPVLWAAAGRSLESSYCSGRHLLKSYTHHILSYDKTDPT